MEPHSAEFLKVCEGFEQFCSDARVSELEGLFLLISHISNKTNTPIHTISNAIPYLEDSPPHPHIQMIENLIWSLWEEEKDDYDHPTPWVLLSADHLDDYFPCNCSTESTTCKMFDKYFAKCPMCVDTLENILHRICIHDFFENVEGDEYVRRALEKIASFFHFSQENMEKFVELWFPQPSSDDE
jgi:hypothetical protein